MKFLLSTVAFLLTLIYYTSSIAIDCEFSYKDWVVVGNVYTCEVNNLYNRNATANVTEIKGTHLQGLSNNDVKKINIDMQTCEFLPYGFEKFFPNIEGLRIAHSELVSLAQDDIGVFPKLKSVDIFNNNLMWLDGNVFEKNPEIEYLYFGDNRLRSIGYNALQPLKKLKYAVFQYNICTRKNAINRAEVEELQTTLNEHCDPDHKTIVQEKKRISKLLEERNAQREKIEELAEIIKDEDSKIMWLLWIFIPLLVCGIVAALYFYRTRYRYLSHVSFGNMDRSMKRTNEIANEPLVNEPIEVSNIYSNGATNPMSNINLSSD